MSSRLIADVCRPRTRQIISLSLHPRTAELKGAPRPNRQLNRRFLRHCTRAASLTRGKKRKTEEEEEEEEEEPEEEFDDFSAEDDSNALTTQQVQTLLNVVCDETEIAEIELKIGGFSMKMRRKLSEVASLSQSSAQAAVQPHSAVELPFQSTASIDESQMLSPPQSANGSTSSMEEDDLDENLLYIGSPKVGILRRGRYIKGKKIGKGPLIEVGASVKKGQTLAYIEQLGTFVPVEAPQAGEIKSIVIEDGKAVEYKQIILELSPFFGGHIIGDKKYA